LILEELLVSPFLPGGDWNAGAQKKAASPKKHGPIENWLPFVDAFRTLLLRLTPEIEVLFSNIRNSGWVVQNVQEG